MHYLPTRRTMYALLVTARGTTLEMAAAEKQATSALAAEFLDSLRTQESADSRRARELAGMLHATLRAPH